MLARVGWFPTIKPVRGHPCSPPLGGLTLLTVREILNILSLMEYAWGLYV